MQCKILFDVEIYFHFYPERLMNTTVDPLFYIPKGIHFPAVPVAIYTFIIAFLLYFNRMFVYKFYPTFDTPCTSCICCILKLRVT